VLQAILDWNMKLPAPRPPIDAARLVVQLVPRPPCRILSVGSPDSVRAELIRRTTPSGFRQVQNGPVPGTGVYDVVVFWHPLLARAVELLQAAAARLAGAGLLWIILEKPGSTYTQTALLLDERTARTALMPLLLRPENALPINDQYLALKFTRVTGPKGARAR
jgi:hypothetical protein